MQNDTPNYIKAELDYMDGMKYKDIASKYGVSLATVKSWKTRYGWNRKKVCTQKNEKVCIQNNKKDAETRRAIAEDVEQVINNRELTDKQRLFCLYYVKCFNTTKAYQKAYGCSYETAASAGYRVLGNVGVREEIQRLKQNRLNREMIDESDIFQKYMDIAFADITDYTEFGTDTVEDPETGEEVPFNYVRLKDSNNVDGTIITEVSKGKDGTKVKLADRMQALKWLADHMDLATAEQRARINKLESDIKREDEKPIQITFMKASEKNGSK